MFVYLMMIMAAIVACETVCKYQRLEFDYKSMRIANDDRPPQLLATGEPLLTSESLHRSSVCYVCGESMKHEQEGVRCLKCDKLHHFDCWTYAGGCAGIDCTSSSFRLDSGPSVSTLY